MKNILKGWLAKNTVTDKDKDDKILVLESAGNLTLEDVLQAMQDEDTGLRPETQKHAVELYHKTLTKLLGMGYSINTGLFRAVPQFRGVIKDGVWNPKENSIYILMVQDKVLRDMCAEAGVKILGEKGETAYILGAADTATRATDGSATPGRPFHMKGKNIKLIGTDANVGIYIVPTSGNKTKLTEDMIVLNNPSDVIILLPADLDKGDYEVQIVTQYSGSNKPLKEPRTISKPMFVGDGGGEVEDPTA